MGHVALKRGTAKLVLDFVQRPASDTEKTGELAVFASEALGDVPAYGIRCVIELGPLLEVRRERHLFG